MHHGTPDPAASPQHSGQRGFGLVEAVVALLVFSIGMMAVAGLSLSVSQLSASSSFRTDQTMAADQVFAALGDQDFATITGGTRTIQVGAHQYSVDVSVTDLSGELKAVRAVVSGVATLPPDTFRTVLRSPGGYPAAP